MTIDNLISWLQEAEDNNTWLVSTQSVKRLLEKIKETEQLTLTDVSQQREPLLAYHKHLDSFNDPTIYNASESMIDDYLANNCG